jgi:hypothetical protein
MEGGRLYAYGESWKADDYTLTNAMYGLFTIYASFTNLTGFSLCEWSKKRRGHYVLCAFVKGIIINFFLKSNGFCRCDVVNLCACLTHG